MSFGRLERTRPEPPMSEINVTPLVDVMLVLLVIFMLTAPLLTTSVRLELPQSSAAAPPAAPADSVRLEINRAGQAFLDGLAVDDAQLARRLAAVAAARPDTEVQLRADQAVPYGRVVAVMGAAQKAGLGRIGFIAEPEAAPPGVR